MKKIICILLILTQRDIILGQYFAPKELIVNATELRFRENPNQHSRIIDIFEYGELLEFLDFEVHGEPNFSLYEKLDVNWLKVRRTSTKEIGYVFGQYVESTNLALKYGQEYSKLPQLNWYGITLKNEIPILNSTAPIIKGSQFFKMIVDSIKSHYILGSLEEFQVGEIDGFIFHNENLLFLKESEQSEITMKNNYKLHLEVCHDIEMSSNEKKETTIERIYVSITNPKGQELLYQELTKQFNHRGTFGFRIHFIGDINNDAIPEILLSPISEKGGRYLWFMSKANILELQSISYFGTGC